MYVCLEPIFVDQVHFLFVCGLRNRSLHETNGKERNKEVT
jgi:hypothetical protein